MSGHIINIRGHRLAVEAKSDAQLKYIKNEYGKRTNDWLTRAAAEDADLIKRMEDNRD